MSRKKLLQQTGNIPKTSASHKNFLEWDSDDSTELESDYENTDEKEMDINYWIIDMKILDTYICDVAVCKLCYSKLELFEIATARAGLGTKLELRCCNVDCLSLLCQKSFYTTKKEGSTYNVNKKAVLAGRLAGKGRSGMAKFLA